MIRVCLIDPQSSQPRQGGTELFEEWESSDSAFIWVDIDSEAKETEEAILQRFSIHPLAIQDALRPRHPPKIERFENFLFMLLRGLDADSQDIEFGVIQLALFVGERFLVTRHSKPSVSVNWMFDKLRTDASIMHDGPGPLAIQIANRLARRYVEILLAFEPRLDEFEEKMFDDPNDTLLSELTGYKSQLRKLTRIASYHKQIAEKLKDSGDSLIGDKLSHELVDLYEQTERTQSLANLHYQISTDLTDGYLGMSSHRLNRVMQILTIITVIFVPLTFLAGIYGMNFVNMPELSTRKGYFVVIGIMFVIAVVQLIYFKRKRWM